MNAKTILWPTDLSPNSLKAAKSVLSLSEKYGARIIVLYVAVDMCSYFPAYGNYPSPHVLQEFQGWEIEDARKKLEAVCDKELKACPNLTLRLVAGVAAKEIVKMAETEKADMIVLSGKGRGESGKTDYVLGGVAETVVKTSPVSVHIVNV